MRKNQLITIALLIILVMLLTRPMKRSDPNFEKVKDLDPSVRRKIMRFVQDVRRLGYEPRITSARRTYQQQAKAHLKDKRNPPAGNTSHERGIAIDMVLLTPEGRIGSKANKETWTRTGVPDLAINKYGMRWGGNFRTYYDPVHFDYLQL